MDNIEKKTELTLDLFIFTETQEFFASAQHIYSPNDPVYVPLLRKGTNDVASTAVEPTEGTKCHMMRVGAPSPGRASGGISTFTALGLFATFIPIAL